MSWEPDHTERQAQRNAAHAQMLARFTPRPNSCGVPAETWDEREARRIVGLRRSKPRPDYTTAPPPQSAPPDQFVIEWKMDAPSAPEGAHELVRFSVLDGSACRERDRELGRAWKWAEWGKGVRLCGYCAVRMRKMRGPDQVTLDHREPFTGGGVDGPWNWILACYACNQAKGDMTEAAFRQILSRNWTT